MSPHEHDPQVGAVTVVGVGAMRNVVVAPNGRHAYAAAARSYDVSPDATWAIHVVDTATHTVISAIDDLPYVIPTSMQVSPDSTRLYVADHNTGSIHVVDVDPDSATRNTVLHALPLAGLSSVDYGAPSALAISPNGERLYAMTNESGLNPALLIIDLNSRTLEGVDSAGDSMAMYATGDHVYVWTEDRHGLNDLTAGVKIFNADTGEVLGFVGFDNAPAFLRQPILTAGHGRLYLDIDDLDGHLEVIDTAAFDVVARIRIDTSPEGDLRDIPVSAALSPNGRHLYVANQGVRLSSDEATEVGWVSIIDTETNNVISEIALTQPGISESYCPNPEFVAIGRGGNRLLVACQNGIALIIDIESKTVVDVVTLRHPTQVVAANLLRNTVYIGTTGEAGLTVIPL